MAPPLRAAVLLMNLELIIVPFEAPLSNPIAPPLPVYHLLSPLPVSLASLYVLFAVPSAVLSSNKHKSNVTLSLS